jgi:hypothetical protein
MGLMNYGLNPRQYFYQNFSFQLLPYNKTKYLSCPIMQFILNVKV